MRRMWIRVEKIRGHTRWCATYIEERGSERGMQKCTWVSEARALKIARRLPVKDC